MWGSRLVVPTKLKLKLTSRGPHWYGQNEGLVPGVRLVAKHRQGPLKEQYETVRDLGRAQIILPVHPCIGGSTLLFPGKDFTSILRDQF